VFLRDKIKDKIILLQYLTLTITLIVMIVENIEKIYFWQMILIAAFLLFTFSIRNLYLYNSEKFGKASGMIILLDIALIFLMMRLDSGSSTIVFFYLIISDTTINFSPGIGLLTTILSFSAYVIHTKIELGKVEALAFVTKSFQGLVPFMVIYLFLYVVKYVMKQNEIIDRTLIKLTAKTLEQEMTYQELKVAYEKQEDITILKERNKIAREIHDTLGHTLTTVIVETEAGKILLNKDFNLALEKFDCAQDQLRKGLDDLRLSVRLLEKGDELVDFKTSLESFIKDTQKHTGLIIKYDIDLKGDINLQLRKTLYRALQEGITNGIKHGGSTVFVFKLEMSGKSIDFLLQDNGKGCSAVIPGFGLKAMQERVKDLKGIMSFESEQDEGFILKISLPHISRSVLHE